MTALTSNNNIPDEFLDPVLSAVMRNPVIVEHASTRCTGECPTAQLQSELLQRFTAEGRNSEDLPPYWQVAAHCCHVFDRGSILACLDRNNTCPTCRREVIAIRPAPGDLAERINRWVNDFAQQDELVDEQAFERTFAQQLNQIVATTDGGRITVREIREMMRNATEEQRRALSDNQAADRLPVNPNQTENLDFFPDLFNIAPPMQSRPYQLREIPRGESQTSDASSGGCELLTGCAVILASILCVIKSLACCMRCFFGGARESIDI